MRYCIKKELSAPFIAPESFFVVLLSYTQFFIDIKFYSVVMVLSDNTF